MALINCPECNNEVSTLAAACVKCGAPIAGTVEIGVDVALTTTQETGKNLKTHVALSALLFWGGFMSMFAIDELNGPNESPIIPVIAATIGLAWYLITRTRIWWHHK